jgi:hypothetical protein
MVLSPSNLRPNQRLKLIPLKNASGQAEWERRISLHVGIYPLGIWMYKSY